MLAKARAPTVGWEERCCEPVRRQALTSPGLGVCGSAQPCGPAKAKRTLHPSTVAFWFRGTALSAFSECVYTVRCTRDTRLLCVRLRNGQSCGVRRGAVVSFPRRRQPSGLRAKRPSIAFQLVIPAEREDSPDVRRRTVRCDWGVPKVRCFRSSGREGGRTKKLFGGRSSCWPGATRSGSAAAQVRSEQPEKPVHLKSASRMRNDWLLMVESSSRQRECSCEVLSGAA